MSKLTFSELHNKLSPSASVTDGLNRCDIKWNLAVGMSDLDCPEELSRVLQECAGKPHPYVSSRGSLDARAAVGEVLVGGVLDPERNLLLTQGAKCGLMLSLMGCAKRGGSVWCFEPYWLGYPNLAVLLNLKFISLNLGEFRDSQSFEKYLNRQKQGCGLPDCIIINSPNNPSGLKLSSGGVDRLISWCRANGVWLIIDEVYKDFDESHLVPRPSSCVIRVGSISKNLNLPGIRLGYISASNAVINLLDVVMQNSLTCISYQANELARSMGLWNYSEYLNEARLCFKQRQLLLSNSVPANRIYGADERCGFYALIRRKESCEDIDGYVEYLRMRGIAVTSGGNYGNAAKDYVRVCLVRPQSELNEILRYV